MHPLTRFAVVTLFAPGLAAQYFAEHERSMYSTPVPMNGNVGGNNLVIDVDGDGFLDVLAGTPTSNYYRNDGYGRFNMVASGLGNAYWVRPQAIGDYNGDGLLDYCTGSNLFRSQGGGVFAVDPTISVFTLAGPPAAFLDYDGDGDLDWMPNAFGLRLFANNGTGSFTEVTATVLAGFDREAQVFRVADLDHDGDADVVKCGGGFGPTTLKVWRNQGSGGFLEETLPQVGGLGAMSTVNVADFDGDGALDIAVASFGSMAGATFGAWVVSGAAGASTLSPLTFGGSSWSELLFADLGDWNGDGRADWIVRTGVYLQTSPLQFTFQPYAWGSFSNTPMLVDLDYDGHLDLIAPGAQGYVRNATTSPFASERPWVKVSGPYGSVVATTTKVHVRRRSVVPPVDDFVFTAPQGVMWGSDAPLPGEEDRTLRLRLQSGADAALVSPPPGGSLGLISMPGPAFFEIVQGALVAASAPPPLSTWSQVHAADLDGQPGDEVVFGSFGYSGPMIFTRNGAGWSNVSPAVSAPASVTAQSHEQILLVDVDGDGDRDIVHESRWLRNDGGTWFEAGSFHALVPSGANCLIAVDFDRDGDQDLFLGAAAGSSRLLRNTPNGFVTAPAAWLPTGLGIVTRVASGDVDGDGADDLLLIVNNRSLLLRNTGTAFTLVGDVGPAGLLVDLNHDDRPDLFTGTRVFWNNTALLWSSGPARRGSWQLHFDMRDQSMPFVLSVLMLSLSEATLPWPGVGTLYIDPTNFASFLLPVFSGSAAMDLPIPTSAAVIGLPLRSQVLGLDAPGYLLSNVVRDSVH